MEPLIPIEYVEKRIYLIREQKVMLSVDLAALYHVSAKALLQAVKRNKERFPPDFMFRLTMVEAEASRSQFVTLKRGQNIKYAPYAFTEQGVAMLSSVLRSPRAIQANIAIMRAFVRLRELLATHKELSNKLEEHEQKLASHEGRIDSLFDAVDQILNPPVEPSGRSGSSPKLDSG